MTAPIATEDFSVQVAHRALHRLLPALDPEEYPDGANSWDVDYVAKLTDLQMIIAKSVGRLTGHSYNQETLRRYLTALAVNEPFSVAVHNTKDKDVLQFKVDLHLLAQLARQFDIFAKSEVAHRLYPDLKVCALVRYWLVGEFIDNIARISTRGHGIRQQLVHITRPESVNAALLLAFGEVRNNTFGRLFESGSDEAHLWYYIMSIRSPYDR